MAAAFPPASKARTVAVVHDVEHALDQDITTLDWMQPATKEQAKIKLHAIEDKIGYPDKWRDYSSVKITRTSYLNNVREATVFEFHRQLDKIGKPVDRVDDDTSDHQRVLRCAVEYHQLPCWNSSAAIFDPTMDDAVNYGAIGMVVGHEITHGFDDQGRKFDAQGNLRDWWTEADAKAYDERDACIADEYSQEFPRPASSRMGI